MLCFRLIFSSLLVFTLYFFGVNAHKLNISTSLNDLAPEFSKSAESAYAIDTLSQGLNKRLVFLVQTKDNNVNLEQVTQKLKGELSSINELKAAPNEFELLQEIVKQLTPYRFNLLTPQQQQRLRNSDSQSHKIADQAYRDLFSMDKGATLFTFAQDPLNWHNSYITNLLQDLPTNPNQDTDSQVLVFNIIPKQLGLNEQQALLEKIDLHVNSVVNQHNIDIFRSGIFFFATDAASESKKNISVISTVSIIGVFTLLLLTFRSLVTLVLPFLSIAFGVAFAFALTHAIYGSVHVLTIVFGASLIGIVIDYSLHFFYHSTLSNDQTNNSRKLTQALGLSLITSIIGYAALSFSSVVALQKVALFSCAGLTMAWLSVVCLGSLSIKKQIKTHTSFLINCLAYIQKPISKLSNKSIRFMVVGVLAIGISTPLLITITDDNPRLFFKPSPELLKQEKVISSQVSDFEPGSYFIITADSADTIQQQFDQLKVKLKSASPNIDRQLTSIIHWIPSQNEQAKNYQLQSALYGESAAASELFTLLNIDNNELQKSIELEYQQSKGKYIDYATINTFLDNSLPPLWVVQPTSDELGNEKQESAIVLIKKGTDISQFTALSSDLSHVDFINTVADSTIILKDQRISSTWLLAVAYILISILLLVRFKSLAATFMVLIPAASTCVLFIVFAILGLTLNLFHIMALFLVLGLGMDYSIFIKTMRTHINTTHQAIFLSAVTSLLSFGLLSASSTPVVSAFGTTLLIGNCCNLIGALIYSEYLKNDK